MDLRLGRFAIELGDIHLIYQVVHAARSLFHPSISMSAEWMCRDKRYRTYSTNDIFLQKGQAELSDLPLLGIDCKQWKLVISAIRVAEKR